MLIQEITVVTNFQNAEYPKPIFTDFMLLKEIFEQ